MTKLSNRRRSRPLDLPPNLASGLIFLSVLTFAFGLILLNVGTLAAVATFIAAVVAAAAGSAVAIRNGRSRTDEVTDAIGGTTAAGQPAVKLPPPGTMGPAATTVCTVLFRVTVIATMAMTAIIAAYGADSMAISPPVEEPPAPSDPAGS